MTITYGETTIKTIIYWLILVKLVIFDSFMHK